LLNALFCRDCLARKILASLLPPKENFRGLEA
jgi:hypothetical protein